jgi:uncharacterized protein YegL
MAKAKSKPEAKQTKAKPRSYVTFLLDRSGSMSSIHSQTVEGFNTYLTGLKAEKNADIIFTFLQFDSYGVDKRVVAEPVGKVSLLTIDGFEPRGGTPLIDATYKTIKAVEEAVANEESKPKVVICIQTDGFENESHDHNWNDLSALVKAKQEAGWQFNFMGADIDAYKQAAQMGINRASTVSYGSADLTSNNASFAATASNTTSFSAGTRANVFYTSDQKAKSGDKFDPDLKSKS